MITRLAGLLSLGDEPMVDLAQRAAHLPVAGHDVPGAVDHVRPVDASHTGTCTHRTLFQVGELGKARAARVGQA